MNLDEATSAGRSGTQAALRTVGQLKTGAVDAAHEVGDAVARRAASVSARLANWWDHAAHTALDAAHTVKDEATAINERTQRYVRDEPAKTVFLIVAVGALLTALLAWRVVKNARPPH